MSQIFFLILFLKGSSWAHCQFLSPVLMYLSSFPSLLMWRKVHWCTHTSVNDSHWEFKTCYTYIHSLLATWFIINSFRHADHKTSQLYLHSESSVELSYSCLPSVHTGATHIRGTVLHTCMSHGAVKSQTFILITCFYERWCLFKHICLWGVQIHKCAMVLLPLPYSS